MAADWKDVLAGLHMEDSGDSGQAADKGADVNRGEAANRGETLAEPAGSPKAKKDPLKVFIDRKGRKGKAAVIVEGFTVSDDEVAETAAWLKRKLGVGGSSRGGEILIQGDCRDRIADLLRQLGHKVTLAGG